MKGNTLIIKVLNSVKFQAKEIGKGLYEIHLDLNSQGLQLNEENHELLLADYMERHQQESLMAHRGNSYLRQCKNMEKWLKAFLDKQYDTMRMEEVDVQLCRKFAEHLRTGQNSRGKTLSATSAHHYFGAFKSMLTAAVKDEVIERNPIELMKRGEIPARPTRQREYMDAEEVARLTVTPCKNDEVKRAFLFSCLTGLRISDIRQLSWSNLHEMGGEWYCQIVMQKTQEPIKCKLTETAYALLEPTEGKREGKIFHLPCDSTIGRTVKKWTEQAGITKHVTFHTARHSYATIALMTGVDIYIISRQLGHKNIQTTTIYATVVDAQRDAASDSVSKIYEEHLNKVLQKQQQRE